MHIMLLILSLITSEITLPKLDFGTGKAGMNWRVINDGVMGGLSKGFVEVKENSIVFKGKVSLENNGGFSAFKSRFQKIDLSQFEQVKIRLRSQGIKIALTLETDQRWYYPYFKKDIASQSSDWEIVRLNLKDFEQYRIGQKTGTQLDKSDLNKIIRLGLITNEKRAGGFQIEIDYIQFE